MVTKTMTTSSEQPGSWSKLFGTQRQRTYRGDYGRYTSYESKAAALEKTFKRDNYAPTRYTGVGGDYSLNDNRTEFKKTTINRYDAGGYKSSSLSYGRSASVDRDVARSVRDTDKYFQHHFSSAPRREEEEVETDVLKRMKKKLRQRSYSMDREVTSSGDYDAPFKVVPKRKDRFAGVINNQKQRAKLGERIEEIYNTKYTRPASSSRSSSSYTSAFARYCGDDADDAYTGFDYRTLIDGIPNRYRTRGYSTECDVSARSSGVSRLTEDRDYTTRASSVSRLTADRDYTTRASSVSRLTADRDYTTRASSVSRLTADRDFVTSRSASVSRMAADRDIQFARSSRHEKRSASVSRYEDLHVAPDYTPEYSRKSNAMMRAEYGRDYVKEFNTDRRNGSDISSFVLDSNADFQPDHVRVINLSSGKQAVSYDRTIQTGHGEKNEANAAIERVIERTRIMQQNMYTLEDFVRANRSLFPEDTQIQQQIRFFQLNEDELAEVGEGPDAVVYGVKIKEKLIVPRGNDVTAALNKYYSNKGSVHVDLEERKNIRREAEQEVDISSQERHDSIRRQVEKEFEQRDAKRILGDERLDLKEAQRQVEHRDDYGHLHSHVTPQYIRSYYVNAGLDYDSIYEISRSRRSSIGSIQSDVESVCTRTSRASSASSKRRNRADTAPNFTAKLRPKKCEENQTVRFNASVSGLPMPDVSWFKGNRVITEGPRIHVSNNYGLLSLEITKVKRDDAGIYTVKAQNLEGEVACSAPLDVQEVETFTEKKDGTKKPWFIVEAQNTWAEVGGRATFEAQASGAPVPAFKWQRDNINLTEGDRVRVFTDEAGHVKLVIKNVTHSDAGLYFCIADNRTGKAKCAATLRVVDKGQLQDEGRQSRETTPLARRRRSMSRDMTPVAPLPERKAMPTGNEPWFIQKPPSTMNVHEGEVLALNSIVDGDPKPKVTWLKEPHRELTYSKRHRVVASGANHMMEISSAVMTDAGRFICLAENEFGRIASATFVNMLPPRAEADDDLEAKAQFIKLPEFDYEIELNKERGKMAPMFTKRLPISKEVDQGSNLEVICHADEADTPEYTKDYNVHMTVTKEASIKTVTIGKGGEVLSTETRALSPVSSTSTTTPDAPEDHAPAPAPVPSAPVPSAPVPSAPAHVAAPAFEKSFEDKSVKVGKAVKLIVKVSGSPTPSVTFIKNGTLMEQEGDTYDIGSKENGEHFIEFCDVESDDAGEYSCTATNAAGTATSSCKLTVEQED